MARVISSVNLNSVTYARAETLDIVNGATLLVDSTPATRPGIVRCITSGKFRIQNYTTTPLIFDLDDPTHDFIFTAGGKFEIDGLPIELGVGTGGAVTFDFNVLVPGARHCTYAEVETALGSGVYVPWPILEEDTVNGSASSLLNATLGVASPNDFTAGNTLAGQVLFWHETNRTLRCGNGTQGGAIPNGCRVRVPNIYISNRLKTNASRAMNIVTVGTPTSGKFNLEIRNEAGVLLGTTADIAFNATAATIDTAIEAVTGAGTVTPGGGALPTAVSVTWAGALTTGFGNFPSVVVVNSTLAGGTNPNAFVYENNAANQTLINLTPTGTADFKWVSFSHKIRAILDSFTSVKIRSCGFGSDAFQCNSSNGEVDIDCFQHTTSPWTSHSATQIVNVFGNVKAVNMAGFTKSPATFKFTLLALPKLIEVRDITFGFFGARNATTNRAIQINTIKAGSVLKNVTAIGGPYTIANCQGVTLLNFGYADGVGNVQNTLQAVHVFNLTFSPNLLISGYRQAGPQTFRDLFVIPDSTSTDLVIYGGGQTIDMKNHGQRAVYLGSAGYLMQDLTFKDIRTGPIINTIANYLANSTVVRKVFGTYATQPANNAGLHASTGGKYDLVSQEINKMSVAFSGATDYVGGNFAAMSLTPTTGHVTFGPFGSGEGLELTGSAFVDAVGGVALPTAGDSFTATIPFPMHGITGFQNVESYLYVDAEGAIANVNLVISIGVPTGGTFSISIYNAAGDLVGTTSALAHSATATTVRTALETVMGTGNVSVSGLLTTGFTITGLVAYAGIGFRATVDGSLLTGGTEPGIAYAYGRARLKTGIERLGAFVTAEFAVRVPNTDWPALTALTGANLASSIPGLTGYQAGVEGLEMRIKVTALTSSPYTKFNMISCPTTIDPTLWVFGDAYIKLNGSAPTDVTRAFRLSDDVELYAFTGAGVKEFVVGANYDTAIYLRRENASGRVLMTTYPQTISLTFGDNGEANLYYGSEIQLAQNQDIELIREKTDLIPAINARLPADPASQSLVSDVLDLVAGS